MELFEFYKKNLSICHIALMVIYFKATIVDVRTMNSRVFFLEYMCYENIVS